MYHVILEPQSNQPSLVTDYHGFVETYSDYLSAKADGEVYKKNGDCHGYDVVAVCTDDRHYII